MSSMIPIKFPANFVIGQTYTFANGKQATWQSANSIVIDGNEFKIDLKVIDDTGITFYVTGINQGNLGR